jgi:hypothetical protein
MKANYLTIEEGFDLAISHNVAYLNCEPKFVSIISETFSLKPICIVAFNNDKPIIGLVAYAKRKSIIHPSVYIYTAIWQTSSSNIKNQEAFAIIINKLQNDYLSISLLLPPKITDIRPFTYSGFKADVKYTYVNDLNNIKLSSDVKSMRNRATSLGVTFKFDKNSSDIFEQNISSFSNFGYKQKNIKLIETFIKKLIDAEYIVAISAHLNDELLASGYVLLDKNNGNAMNLFITSKKSNYQTGVHSYLYLQNFYALRDAGFLTNDLIGANTKGIGNFKSNFNGELTPFYHVRYFFVRWKLVVLINNGKKLLRKIRISI